MFDHVQQKCNLLNAKTGSKETVIKHDMIGT